MEEMLVFVLSALSMGLGAALNRESNVEKVWVRERESLRRNSDR